MRLIIPNRALVILIGASGSGKTTFARRHFKPTAVLSSDAYRAIVSDDENNLAATADAFGLLHLAARKRLAAGYLTVIDATNVLTGARASLLGLAQDCQRPTVAVVLDMPLAVCLDRNRRRTDRTIPEPALRRQVTQLRRSFAGLDREGFGYVYTLRAPADVDNVVIDLKSV
jgi:protein phosphatase